MANQTCPDCRSWATPQKHDGASHCTDCLRHFFVSRSGTGSCPAPGCESPMLPGYCRACVRDMPWALYTALRAALGNPEPSRGGRPLTPTLRALEKAVARPETRSAWGLADGMDSLQPSLARMLERAFERIDAEKAAKAEG